MNILCKGAIASVTFFYHSTHSGFVNATKITDCNL